MACVRPCPDPFVNPVPCGIDQIPFHTLLKPINETYRQGLEVDDTDA